MFGDQWHIGDRRGLIRFGSAFCDAGATANLEFGSVDCRARGNKFDGAAHGTTAVQCTLRPLKYLHTLQVEERRLDLTAQIMIDGFQRNVVEKKTDGRGKSADARV